MINPSLQTVISIVFLAVDRAVAELVGDVVFLVFITDILSITA